MTGIRKDVLTYMPLGCTWAQDLMENVNKTCLSKSPLRGWIPMKMHIVDNPDLEEAFEDRKETLRKMGRTEEELKEVFCFVAESWKAVVSMCKYGIRCSVKKTNILGDTRAGIHLNRNFDMLLKFMSFRNFVSARCIVVLKVIPGRSKRVMPRFKGRTLLHPSKHYDSHVSMIDADPNIPINEGLANNFIYIYQLDDETRVPLQHPRNAVPYAVIQVRQPARLTVGRPFTSFRDRVLAQLRNREYSDRSKRRSDRDKKISVRRRHRSRSRSRSKERSRRRSRSSSKNRHNSSDKVKRSSTSDIKRERNSDIHAGSSTKENDISVRKRGHSEESTVETPPIKKSKSPEQEPTTRENTQIVLDDTKLSIQSKLQQIEEEIKLRQSKLTELRHLQNNQETNQQSGSELCDGKQDLQSDVQNVKRESDSFAPKISNVCSTSEHFQIDEAVSNRALSSGASTPTLDEPHYDNQGNNDNIELPLFSATKTASNLIELTPSCDQQSETKSVLTDQHEQIVQQQEGTNTIQVKEDTEDKNIEVPSACQVKGDTDDKNIEVPSACTSDECKSNEINSDIAKDPDIRTLFTEAIYQMDPSELYELLTAKLAERDESLFVKSEEKECEDDLSVLSCSDDTGVLDLSCKAKQDNDKHLPSAEVKQESLVKKADDKSSCKQSDMKSIQIGEQSYSVSSSFFLDNLDILASVASEIQEAAKADKSPSKHSDVKGSSCEQEYIFDAEDFDASITGDKHGSQHRVVSKKQNTGKHVTFEQDGKDGGEGTGCVKDRARSRNVDVERRKSETNRRSGLLKELSSLMSSGIHSDIMSTRRRTANSVSAALSASEHCSLENAKLSGSPLTSSKKSTTDKEATHTVERDNSKHLTTADKRQNCRENLFEKFQSTDDIDNVPTKNSNTVTNSNLNIKKEITEIETNTQTSSCSEMIINPQIKLEPDVNMSLENSCETSNVHIKQELLDETLTTKALNMETTNNEENVKKTTRLDTVDTLTIKKEPELNHPKNDMHSMNHDKQETQIPHTTAGVINNETGEVGNKVSDREITKPTENKANLTPDTTSTIGKDNCTAANRMLVNPDNTSPLVKVKIEPTDICESETKMECTKIENSGFKDNRAAETSTSDVKKAGNGNISVVQESVGAYNETHSSRRKHHTRVTERTTHQTNKCTSAVDLDDSIVDIMNKQVTESMKLIPVDNLIKQEPLSPKDKCAEMSESVCLEDNTADESNFESRSSKGSSRNLNNRSKAEDSKEPDEMKQDNHHDSYDSDTPILITSEINKTIKDLEQVIDLFSEKVQHKNIKDSKENRARSEKLSSTSIAKKKSSKLSRNDRSSSQNVENTSISHKTVREYFRDQESNNKVVQKVNDIGSRNMAKSPKRTLKHSSLTNKSSKPKSGKLIRVKKVSVDKKQEKSVDKTNDATRTTRVLNAAFKESTFKDDAFPVIKKEPIADDEFYGISSSKSSDHRPLKISHKDPNRDVRDKVKRTSKANIPDSNSRTAVDFPGISTETNSTEGQSANLLNDKSPKRVQESVPEMNPLEAIRTSYSSSSEPRRRKTLLKENGKYFRSDRLDKIKRKQPRRSRSRSVGSNHSSSSSITGNTRNDRINPNNTATEKRRKSRSRSIEEGRWYVKSKWDANDSPANEPNHSPNERTFDGGSRYIIRNQRKGASRDLLDHRPSSHLGGQIHDQETFFSSSGYDDAKRNTSSATSTTRFAENVNPDDQRQLIIVSGSTVATSSSKRQQNSYDQNSYSAVRIKRERSSSHERDVGYKRIRNDSIERQYDNTNIIVSRSREFSPEPRRYRNDDMNHHSFYRKKVRSRSRERESSSSTDRSIGGYGKSSTDCSLGGYRKPSTDVYRKSSTDGYRRSSTDRSLGGYKKSSADRSLDGYRKSSTDRSLGGYKKSSADRVLGGYKRSSTDRSLGGYRKSSVDRSLDGYRQSSAERSLGGYRKSSVDRSLDGYRKSSADRSLGGYRKPPTDLSLGGYRNESSSTYHDLDDDPYPSRSSHYQPTKRFPNDTLDDSGSDRQDNETEINSTLSKAMTTLLKKIIFNDKTSDNTKEDRMAEMVLDMVKAKVVESKSQSSSMEDSTDIGSRSFLRDQRRVSPDRTVTRIPPQDRRSSRTYSSTNASHTRSSAYDQYDKYSSHSASYGNRSSYEDDYVSSDSANRIDQTNSRGGIEPLYTTSYKSYSSTRRPWNKSISTGISSTGRTWSREMPSHSYSPRSHGSKSPYRSESSLVSIKQDPDRRKRTSARERRSPS